MRVDNAKISCRLEVRPLRDLEKKRVYGIKYRAEHREELNRKNLAHYHAHRDYYIQQKKDYREKNRERLRDERLSPEGKERRRLSSKRFYEENKGYYKERDRKVVLFKDRKVRLGFCPRTGKCSICGATNKKTNIHHVKYHKDKPLKDTIELCFKCHMQEHRTKKGGIT